MLPDSVTAALIFALGGLCGYFACIVTVLLGEYRAERNRKLLQPRNPYDD